MHSGCVRIPLFAACPARPACTSPPAPSPGLPAAGHRVGRACVRRGWIVRDGQSRGCGSLQAASAKDGQRKPQPRRARGVHCVSTRKHALGGEVGPRCREQGSGDTISKPFFRFCSWHSVRLNPPPAAQRRLVSGRRETHLQQTKIQLIVSPGASRPLRPLIPGSARQCLTRRR